MMEPLKYNSISAHANRDMKKTVEIWFNEDGSGDCTIILREMSRVVAEHYRPTLETARDVARSWLNDNAYQ